MVLSVTCFVVHAMNTVIASIAIAINNDFFIFLFIFVVDVLTAYIHLRNHGVYSWMILKFGFVPDMPLVAVVAFVSCHLSGIIWVINLPLGYSLLCRFFVFVPHLLFED